MGSPTIRPFGNATRVPSRGAATYIPLVGRRGAHMRYLARLSVEGEPETPEQAARLLGAHLKLHTSLPTLEAMQLALLVLGKVGFDTVVWFRGPVRDPTPERKDGMHVRDVAEALGALEEPRLPLLGLKADLRYRRDEDVVATVSVGRIRPSKVRVRVRGAVFKSDWFGLKNLLERELEDIDRDG